MMSKVLTELVKDYMLRQLKLKGKIRSKMIVLKLTNMVKLFQNGRTVAAFRRFGRVPVDKATNDVSNSWQKLCQDTQQEELRTEDLADRF